MKKITFIISLYCISLATMAQQSTDTVAYGCVYAERYDDIAWENDLVGFRAYGPGIQKDGQKLYGYDIFLKRGTSKPILPKMYKDFFAGISYHEDHGFGMDCYAVGPTLGAGVTAILDNDGKILYPWCYKDLEILENGPKRVQVRLSFPPFKYNGADVTEIRPITLDEGMNLNHTKVEYKGLTQPVKIVSGIVLHDDSSVITDPDRQYLAYTDPTQGKDNGQVFMGLFFPSPAESLSVIEHDGIKHAVGVNTYTPGTSFEYYWGFGWERGNIPSMSVWIELLTDLKKAQLSQGVH